VEEYFKLLSDELLLRLNKIRKFVTKHNPTIGSLTESVIREFLSKHLPKSVSVNSGFIIDENLNVSPQCDILIWDSLNYAPIYQNEEIVIIPVSSVKCLIEVKTTINKTIFASAIKYFSAFNFSNNFRKYLFILNCKSNEAISNYLINYNHPGKYKNWDHDTYGKETI